jgi:hypothetical protein
MSAILARTTFSLIEISSDNLEMADNFGISEEERTGYNFPTSVPYIYEMQEQDKKLMIQIKKDSHKYELSGLISRMTYGKTK